LTPGHPEASYVIARQEGDGLEVLCVRAASWPLCSSGLALAFVGSRSIPRRRLRGDANRKRGEAGFARAGAAEKLS
jgi:hypothetical protein